MMHLKENGNLYLEYREGEYYAELYGMTKVVVGGKSLLEG
jgi:hypothetical protein